MSNEIDWPKVGLWTAALDQTGIRRVIHAVRSAEDLGFDALWISETSGRDPLVLASILLSNTKRLKVGIGIANIYARDPLAMVAAGKTICEANPHRLLLGLGVSSPFLVETVRGHVFQKPIATMDTYLTAMSRAKYMAIDNNEGPLVVLGALGPHMLRLAADKTHGAHTYLVTPEHTRTARGILGAGKILAVEQKVVLGTNRDDYDHLATRAIFPYLHSTSYIANLERLGFSKSDWTDPKHPSENLKRSLVAFGSEEAIHQRVREHLEAGADHVAIQVLSRTPGPPTEDWTHLQEILGDFAGL